MESKIIRLKNNIELFYKKNLNTPRIAFCMNFALVDGEVAPGVNSLVARLLFQGTKSRSAEQIALEFDNNGIDFSVEMRADYLRFRFVCLNEDFEKAIELVNDLVKNSTFEEFDKEIVKLEGEIVAELDAARAKASDGYTKNIFEGHSYGYSNTVILENLKNITKQQVVETYQKLLNDSKKIITVVGDVDYSNVENVLNEYLGDLSCGQAGLVRQFPSELNEVKNYEIIKPDANQAHIIKGWRVESVDSEDYPALILLNIILGASGLSSRLFLELRDKKGLAYVVRSSYETMLNGATFSIYIATEPKNIDVSLAGFGEEIEKIKTIPVGEDELEDAKNNILGKWAFSFETNAQQACNYAHYGILDLGFDFNDKTKERVKAVTSEQLQACANKYFNDKFVISILKP
ncbi:insulinase family protein [bacterium]|nr:insulinase family protein [bacterium]